MTEVGAVFITGFGAAVIALWGIFSQRSIARCRATVDYITMVESDKDVIEAHHRFIELAKGDGGLAPFAEEAKEKETDTQKIKTVINSYELVSIGIQRGILDYELYRRWYRGGILQYWAYTQPFAHRLRERTGNQALYHEFEELARWMRGEPMPKRHWWWGKFG